MLTYIYNLATDKYKGFTPSIIKVFLFVLSLVYGMIIRIISFIYGFNKYSANCRVISVGNITLGGTGKTPLVEYIAGYLKQQGHKVAIVTRGYKRLGTRDSGFGSRANPESRIPNPETMGDEPYMLKKNLKDIPVVVSSERIRGIKNAVRNYGADTVILDDGLQQWKIKKDLEIVVIDSRHPFGNRNMIPRGILRQPLSSLKKADIFILTKTDLNPDTRDISNFLNKINPLAMIIKSAHKPAGLYSLKDQELINPDTLKDRPVTLFCGIGDPESFKNIILKLGINIGLFFSFNDHYFYSRQDLDNIVRASKGKDIDTIITTEKDSVKLSALSSWLSAFSCQMSEERFFVLRIELKIMDDNDKKRFQNRLLKLYSV